MKENYFQSKLVKHLRKSGYFVQPFCDSFTSGIPDVYAARDGKSYWLEVKVINKKKGIIHFADENSSSRGFSKSQRIKIYKIKQAGIEAYGVCYVVALKKIVKVPLEIMDKSVDFEDLKELEEFDLI